MEEKKQEHILAESLAIELRKMKIKVICYLNEKTAEKSERSGIEDKGLIEALIGE